MHNATDELAVRVPPAALAAPLAGDKPATLDGQAARRRTHPHPGPAVPDGQTLALAAADRPLAAPGDPAASVFDSAQPHHTHRARRRAASRTRGAPDHQPRLDRLAVLTAAYVMTEPKAPSITPGFCLLYASATLPRPAGHVSPHRCRPRGDSE